MSKLPSLQGGSLPTMQPTTAKLHSLIPAVGATVEDARNGDLARPGITKADEFRLQAREADQSNKV